MTSLVPDPPALTYSSFRRQALLNFRINAIGIDRYYPYIAAVLVLVVVGAHSVPLGIVLAVAALVFTKDQILARSARYLYCTAWAEATGWPYYSGMSRLVPSHDLLRAPLNNVVIGDGFIFEGGGVANVVINHGKGQDQYLDENKGTRYMVAWTACGAPNFQLRDRTSTGDMPRLFHEPGAAVELESIDFHERFELRAGEGADQLKLRMLFDPRVIDDLNEGRLQAPVVCHGGYVWGIVRGNFKPETLHADLERCLEQLGHAVALVRR